jgi:hypothetical protein
MPSDLKVVSPFAFIHGGADDRCKILSFQVVPDDCPKYFVEEDLFLMSKR